MQAPHAFKSTTPHFARTKSFDDYHVAVDHSSFVSSNHTWTLCAYLGEGTELRHPVRYPQDLDKNANTGSQDGHHKHNRAVG